MEHPDLETDLDPFAFQRLEYAKRAGEPERRLQEYQEYGTEQILNARWRGELDRHANANPEGDLWLVLYGDWGGQIYATVPWSLVGPRAQIYSLSAKFDSRAWACNEGDGAYADLFCAKTPDQYFVSGGMGGGVLVEGDLWLHDEFSSDEDRALATRLLDIQLA
ncbi:MAG TPA: hypothetical protein VFQ60_01190 [Patescibacteria group bacterium]|nr:hypothetical protein [Patescibacteria group bacterium]